MRDAATPEEIASYQEHGFVVLPSLLDATELARWRERLHSALERRRTRLPDPGGEYGEFFRSEHEYYDRVFTQRIDLRLDDPAVAELVCSPALGRIAAQLAGAGGVRIYLDQALVKEPYANPTGFHVDVPFWSFSSPDALTIWVALDDATAENGCLCYLPGTHRTRRYDNADIGPQLGALFGVYPEWRSIDPVFCPVPAGSAVAHNGLTAHGAGANMTRRRRFAMTVAYMPDGAAYNGKQDIMTTDEAARLRVGDPLDDPVRHPLLPAV